MTRDEAIRALKDGGPLPELAEAIGILVADPQSSLQEIMLGLSYPGFVQEQAAIALYRRTGNPLPVDRTNLRVTESDWTSYEEARSMKLRPQASSRVSVKSSRQNTQFSIFLINKPGVLSEVFRELAKAKVSIKAGAMMDSMEHGILRMVVDDVGAARTVLGQLNIPVTENKVLEVTLSDHPTALPEVCESLSIAHIQISYMYCTTSGVGQGSMLVLKVPDITRGLTHRPNAQGRWCLLRVLENAKNPRPNPKIKLRRQPGSIKR